MFAHNSSRQRNVAETPVLVEAYKVSRRATADIPHQFHGQKGHSKSRSPGRSGRLFMSPLAGGGVGPYIVTAGLRRAQLQLVNNKGPMTCCVIM